MWVRKLIRWSSLWECFCLCVKFSWLVSITKLSLTVKFFWSMVKVFQQVKATQDFSWQSLFSFPKVLTEHEKSTNHIFLKKKPRCYAKSHTTQDAVQLTEVTRRRGLLSHTQNAVRWLVISKRSAEAPQTHHPFVQLSFMPLSLFKDCSDCNHHVIDVQMCASIPELPTSQEHHKVSNTRSTV